MSGYWDAARLIILSCSVQLFLISLTSLSAQDVFQPATTVQQPTFGVSIDAQGVLRTPKFAEAGDPLFQQRAAVAKAMLPADVFAPSRLRKISLRRLHQAIKDQLDHGQPLGDTITKLAGLLRLEYVFVFPQQGDIVVAGPAEGWMEDASGRVVGVTSGRPTILLEDLVVAMRAYGPGQPGNLWVGCTINPQADGLMRLAKFNRSMPSVIPESAKSNTALFKVRGMREALGLANIVVFSISPRTNMARVMVEADYRMKMIAVGLEAPPVRMPTFMSQLQVAPKDSFQRWWLTPDYQAVKLTPDRLSMEIVGDTVRLLTEAYQATAAGQLVKTGRKPSAPAKSYAKNFTKNYPKIARMSPVFQQLRNMVDVLVLAAFFQQESAFEQIGLAQNVFYDETVQLVRLMEEPKKTPCVANAIWKGSRLIAVAGGGVSIQASQALLEESLVPDTKGEIVKMRDEFKINADQTRWWWD